MGRSFKNIVTGLSAREQRLVAVMGILFVLFGVFLGVFVFKSKISDLEDENEALIQSLRLMDEKEADYSAEKLREQQISQKASSKPTPLSTIVDKASRKVEIETPDTKELPDLRHGTQWMEHSVELSFREIDLLKLVEFMEEVEANRRQFPIAVSKLDINKRKRPTDVVYQVDMTISTYEQLSKSEREASRKGGRK
jgi:type II secretory pathway component PulM